MATNFEKLRAKLEEMFMLDRADLDFGIYRIMNSKRDEILRFLDKDLLPQVRQVLQAAQGEIGAAGADELKQAEEQVRSLGMNPDDSPKVKELRARYSAGGDLNSLEQEVFNHLYSFFRRYYDEGDFLSLRRYKEGVYAIPYEGEEVKLHWANADQYYIKTAEHFRDYTFKVGGDRRVHFKLVDAQTEKDNNKATEKRVFILTEENAVSEENGELLIRFEYRAAPDKRKQKEHVEEAVARILAEAHGDWKGLLHAKAPTDKSPNRTVLEKHLTDYTARNTFDYFIHKDLGGFLRRELDFYIKNEVMHLDDIENEAAPKVEQYLAKVKAIRNVAIKLIDLLAQLENFQKRLWLKKKFVTKCDWYVPLHLLSTDYLSAVVNNPLQLKEWSELIGESNVVEMLAVPVTDLAAQFGALTVNLQLIPSDLKQQILRSLPPLNEAVQTLMFKADNFQALQLIRKRYRNSIHCIYIDPPYNAKSSEILYKNTFKHSSFLSFFENRLAASACLCDPSCLINIAIDDYEQKGVAYISDSVFGEANFVANVVVQHNPRGRNDDRFYGTAHEYMLVYARSRSEASLGLFELNEQERTLYSRDDGISQYHEVSFMRTGNNSDRHTRKNLFYPIYCLNGELSLEYRPGWSEILPINSANEEKTWRWEKSTFLSRYQTEISAREVDGKWRLYKKRRLEGAGRKPKTTWTDSRYDASSHGIMHLRAMFGKDHPFSYPKSINTVTDTIAISCPADGTVLDFFAGSGTTAEATIKCNRADGGQRRTILVEMGNYFDSVTVTRIRKAVCGDTWKDGGLSGWASNEAQSQVGVIKVVRLESYEDALENLEITRPSETQASLLAENQTVREEYFLSYFLRSETVRSGSMLSIEKFMHPFAYKMNFSSDTVGETREVSVDLVETFNWLLGLRVHTIDEIRGFRVVTGRLPGPGNSENGEKALIIWRDTTENPNEKLDEFFAKQAYNTLDQEFDVIYVNGDNNLQNLRKDDQTWKVRLIEEEFHRLMWDVEDV